MKKRLLALLLCFAMVLPLVACTPDTPEVTVPSIRPPEELDWLNISTEAFDLPIVKEGTEKTLTIWYRTAGGMEDPEQTWTYKFAVEHMNINLEVRPLYSSNQSEVLSTAFATGDLPDIIIGSKFTTADLVKYGVLEEQLLDLAPYMEAGYMPNLAGLIEMTPAYGEAITDGDGHVWSAPYIGVAKTANGLSRMFLNYDWLEEAGISSVPKTTDEFLAAMRAMKAKDPSRYPVGGSWTSYNPMQYLLNAFGFIGEGTITDISLYNGKVTLPAANREAYGEFVEYMNILYTEGLLHPDFFTMDKDTTNAQMSQGKNGFYMEAPHLSTTEEMSRQWWGAYPLTSSTHATSEWPMSAKAILAGGAVVTSVCKEPELACVFLDWFFDFVNYSNWSFIPMADGPYAQYLCGFQGAYLRNNNTDIGRLDYDTDPKAQKRYGSGWTWATNYVHMWFNRFGLQTDPITGREAYVAETVAGAAMESAADRKDAELDYKLIYLWAMEDTLEPYVITDVLSPNVYFDAETTERIADLMQVINEYANTEFAKFVTGKRSLSELDAYFDELDRLGAQELIGIYSDYYGR